MWHHSVWCLLISISEEPAALIMIMMVMMLMIVIIITTMTCNCHHPSYHNHKQQLDDGGSSILSSVCLLLSNDVMSHPEENNEHLESPLTHVTAVIEGTYKGQVMEIAFSFLFYHICWQHFHVVSIYDLCPGGRCSVFPCTSCNTPCCCCFLYQSINPSIGMNRMRWFLAVLRSLRSCFLYILTNSAFICMLYNRVLY